MLGPGIKTKDIFFIINHNIIGNLLWEWNETQKSSKVNFIGPDTLLLSMLKNRRHACPTEYFLWRKWNGQVLKSHGIYSFCGYPRICSPFIATPDFLLGDSLSACHVHSWWDSGFSALSAIEFSEELFGQASHLTNLVGKRVCAPKKSSANEILSTRTLMWGGTKVVGVGPFASVMIQSVLSSSCIGLLGLP